MSEVSPSSTTRIPVSGGGPWIPTPSGRCDGGPPRACFRGCVVLPAPVSKRDSCRLLLAFRAATSIELAHRLAFELDAVCGMHDAVADGIRDGGVSDDLVPLGDGKLGTEERGG